MSKAYYKHQELCEKHGLGHVFGGEGNEASTIARAALSLVILATFNHTTRLKNGAIFVKFVENFSMKVEKEITAEQLLQYLAGQLVSLRKEADKTFASVRAFASVRGVTGCCGFLVSKENEPLFEGFLKDPVAHVPGDLELKNQLLEGLKKKTKSINKRLRNYDNEKARRDRERKARAITSLSKVLADLDPEFRELAVRALRHNKWSTNKYGSKHHSLQKLLNALNTICSGNNLENWQDEDVIPEAERLASVYWVMNQ
jgi:hypothetical protein